MVSELVIMVPKRLSNLLNLQMTMRKLNLPSKDTGA